MADMAIGLEAIGQEEVIGQVHGTRQLDGIGQIGFHSIILVTTVSIRFCSEQNERKHRVCKVNSNVLNNFPKFRLIDSDSGNMKTRSNL